MVKKKATLKKEDCKICVVKRHGHTEEFDERKVYASVFSACTLVHDTIEQSEMVAAEVCKRLKPCLKGKNHISSSQIFHKVIIEMHRLEPKASFMYEHHRDIN